MIISRISVVKKAQDGRQRCEFLVVFFCVRPLSNGLANDLVRFRLVLRCELDRRTRLSENNAFKLVCHANQTRNRTIRVNRFHR